MKRFVLAVNILLAIAVWYGTYLLMFVDGRGSKALCSLGFALLGAVNARWVTKHGGKKAFALLMSAGLVLAMCGDIAINRSFVKGAAFFGAGHLLFWLAGCSVERPRWADIPGALAVFVPVSAVMLFSKRLVFANGMLWVCLGYALLISLMTGKALGILRHKRSILGAVMLAGSLLFCFSDLMLMLRRFGHFSDVLSVVCICTYYPAVLLLAHSVYHAAEA